MHTLSHICELSSTTYVYSHTQPSHGDGLVPLNCLKRQGGSESPKAVSGQLVWLSVAQLVSVNTHRSYFTLEASEILSRLLNPLTAAGITQSEDSAVTSCHVAPLFLDLTMMPPSRSSWNTVLEDKGTEGG